MPSPFSKKKSEPAAQAAAGPGINITNSELYCEYCFGMSTDAVYTEQSEKLSWVCVHCDKLNVVKNFKLP